MAGVSPTASQPPAPVESRSRERFTEQQLVEILRRAAERQEGLVGDVDGRFSLAEIQQIASEVGITPAHVATAALEVASAAPPPRSGLLGAPTVYRFERWIDGEVSGSTVGELLDIARQETGLQGTVSEALDTVEWRSGGLMDATIVSVARRQGRTKISVTLTRSDAAGLTVIGACVGGLGVAMGIGAPLISAVASSGGLATVAAVLVAFGWGGVGSWLVTRAVWRRIARRWPGHAAALGVHLVEAAQREVDAARKDSE